MAVAAARYTVVLVEAALQPTVTTAVLLVQEAAKIAAISAKQQRWQQRLLCV